MLIFKNFFIGFTGCLRKSACNQLKMILYDHCMQCTFVTFFFFFFFFFFVLVVVIGHYVSVLRMCHKLHHLTTTPAQLTAPLISLNPALYLGLLDMLCMVQ